MVQTREVQELVRQAQDLETHMRELKKAASKHQQQGAAIKRSVTSEQATVDALIVRRTDLLSTAAMEQVRPTPRCNALKAHYASLWCMHSAGTICCASTVVQMSFKFSAVPRLHMHFALVGCSSHEHTGLCKDK